MKKIIYLLPLIALAFLLPLTTVQAGLGDAFGSSSVLSTAASSSGYKADSSVSVTSVIGNVIFIALDLLGTIFLALIIYGGVTWMLAEGNEQRVEKAGNIIRQAIIGLIIVIAAYAISYYLINTFGGQLNS